jgi:ammonia channel protein AmtB
MQAGFAMVETGFTRAKNAGNIIMKNLMDFCIGTPTFWIVGFGIMFGAGNGFFGKIGGIATEANYGSAMLPDGVPFWAFLIFQTVFCATSATIVSGAMAERTKFSSYCIYSFLISLIVYRYLVTGSGAVVSSARWDFMILLVPVPYIWLVVLQPLSVPSSLDLVLENIPTAVNQKLFLVTTLPSVL